MESEEVGRRTTSRNRKPNITLDMEGVLSEKLRSLKNIRRGHLANVTANVNGALELLSDDKNLQEVREKLTAAEEAFLKFKDAHLNYAAEIGSEEDEIECDEYFTREERKFRDFYWTTSDWITRVEANLVAQSLQVDSEVKPEDSVSCVGVRTPSKTSRTSKRSSRAGSRASRTSSLFVARAKEAARVAELKAERLMLEKRQVLEEQRFRLNQEESRLNLEAEIAKTVAKEQALAAITEQSPRSVNLKPVKSEKVFREEVKPPPVVNRAVLNPEAPEWTQPQATNPVCDISSVYAKVPFACGTFDGGTKLQEQQNALQLRQTRIMEMLAVNQNKSKLPQPRVPTFDGNPVEYRTFARAFESLIESRTSSSTERLYYLEQYTAGDVKELVRSCHHLAPDEGYAEARRLIEKKFGDEFRIASAYESKALNWPPVKSEDGSALSRFSVYLASCKNAMKGSQYSSKFDQPDNIQQLILKLPYSMRERWRRVADDIMELQGRPVKFDDLVSFVDREARIATNPVFGRITESSKMVEARSGKGTMQKLLPKSRELSLAAQMNTYHGLDTEVEENINVVTSQHMPPVAPVNDSCCFCNFNHALEDCRSLRSRPYQERIQFLASKNLCFGCLSDKHVAKDCPQRKSCKITNCPKKHPTVLHTQPRERLNGEISTGSADNVSGSATQVRNGMVSRDDSSCSVTGAGRPRTGMSIVPVKVKRKDSDTAIITYALLDSGSSSTFCTESLMKQLGIDGLKTKISLTTLEKKDSLVDSFLVRDLVISDLDENNFIALPVLYTRTEIPVTKDDIPTQEDVDLWPHLGGVYLPNVSAEIGLLIASDVPEALDPLEVKHSEHGGPYASRTRIGWVVNGPLGRYHQGPHSTSFFVKADTELQQMVENYCNLDFNESIADIRTDLSQDERRFMTSVEESTLLKDGHFEIPLPFKDRQFQVPNNRTQAEQRASWLKKRLESIPGSERAQGITKLDLQRDKLPIERALGVQWRIESGKFGFNINVKLRPPTRRGILSIVGSVFHPFDFAAPFLLSTKRILQDLCRIKLSWDDEIPTEYSARWQRWLTDLPKLSQFTIERCLKPANFGNIVTSQLHHFSDVSEIGFGSVSYLRLSDDNGGIHCTILQGKSRLVPLKQVTIPRLELSAAVVSVQLDNVLKRELDFPLTEKSVFWTDSTSVLRYVRNETKRFHTFVANRIAIIRDGSDPDQRRHVSGDLNPGDDLSRGLSAEALLSSDRWIKGPAFLWEQKVRWPQGYLSLGSIPDVDPEVKVGVNVHATSVAATFCPVVHYFRRTSSWHRLKKSIAWFLRYRENLRLANAPKKLAISTPNAPQRRISMEEMRAKSRTVWTPIPFCWH